MFLFSGDKDQHIQNQNILLFNNINNNKKNYFTANSQNISLETSNQFEPMYKLIFNEFNEFNLINKGYKVRLICKNSNITHSNLKELNF